jgi:hypothetical protein
MKKEKEKKANIIDPHVSTCNKGLMNAGIE